MMMERKSGKEKRRKVTRSTTSKKRLCYGTEFRCRRRTVCRGVGPVGRKVGKGGVGGDAFERRNGGKEGGVEVEGRKLRCYKEEKANTRKKELLSTKKKSETKRKLVEMKNMEVMEIKDSDLEGFGSNEVKKATLICVVTYDVMD